MTGWSVRGLAALAARLKISLLLLAGFGLLAGGLYFDLQRVHDKALADTSHRALQQSQIIAQSFRSDVQAADYVLRDVLGRIQPRDLLYPHPDADHGPQMAKLLKEKADTVPDFFSMVLYDRNCVFAATATGNHLGVQSKPALCAARKAHRGAGPLASYVPGQLSASGRSVLVLTRNLISPTGEFLGGVMGVIDLQSAQRRLDALSLEPGDAVALLDQSQVLLARRPLLAGHMEKPALQPQIPASLLAQEAGLAVALQRDADGQERLFGFGKLAGFPFVVAYGVDKDHALHGWRQRAWESLVVLCILLGLALIAARAYGLTLRQRDELAASKVALQELATHDPLTGLYNRRFLDATFRRECARSEREGQPMAIIMLDVDHFKKVNDRYGHAAGDEVLKALAELLHKSSRKSDLVCRYGGEEFVAVMPNMSLEQAVARADAWRRQFEALAIAAAEGQIRATLSAGVAAFPLHGTLPDQLLQRADAMLYQSKREGRNRVSA